MSKRKRPESVKSDKMSSKRRVSSHSTRPAPLSAFAVRQLSLKKQNTPVQESDDKKKDTKSKNNFVEVVVPGVDRSRKDSESIESESDEEPDVSIIKEVPAPVSRIVQSGRNSDTFSPIREASPLSNETSPVDKELEKPELVQLTHKNSLRIGNILYLGLNTGDQASFVGSYAFQCIQGRIEIFGSQYGPNDSNWVPINAPLIYPSPIFRALPGPHEPIVDDSSESAFSSDSSNTETQSRKKIENVLSSFSTILALKIMDNGLSKLAQLYAPARRYFDIEESFENAYDRSSSFEILPPSWVSFADDLCHSLQTKKPVRILVSGPKGSGKSMFARYLANRLLESLNEIQYLDSDPGQAEFLPIGCVSLNHINKPLHGPAFARQNATPLRSVRLHLGDTSPKNDLIHYPACIERLMNEYQHDNFERELSSITPLSLIINCPGWIKGLGAELLQKTIRLTKPTHIVYLHRETSSRSKTQQKSEPNNQDTINSDLFSNVKASIVTTLESAWSFVPNLVSRVPAVETRTMAVLTYLFADAATSSWDMSTSMAARRPFITSFTSEDRGIDAVNIIGEPLNPVDIVDTISGTLVAVCSFDVSSAEEWKQQCPTQTPEGISILFNDGLPLHPATSQCLGYAILKCIDVKRQEFHLVGPLDLDLVANACEQGKKIVLERGRLELPTCAMMDYRFVKYPELPFLNRLQIHGGAGSRVRRVRRNIARRSAFVRT
ncbi:AAA family ATPase Grc3 [Schizosaccharomyces japonicus yFS275]|uniref:Polynucleotide 5'-hydroxyl-kinase GRC3 n=1 Tax=Schizosaccharomyces japonicus (strain yFS275 / FY16936) TaxID=402676 RepID=B6K523_SCHJY|nr:AAA family ATPase Grc3 [Schizosaccharomyces japonicus yFS275]EEB08627.1 AAA family ATPase Grc3 [Schizosaccharomyces japonicus yFS275]